MRSRSTPGEAMVIAHLTDLSGEDEVAFLHAVALAVRAGAKLTTLYASVGTRQRTEFPRASSLLAHWSSASGDARRSLDHEGVVHECCEDTANTLLDALSSLKPELVVAATHARKGLLRVLGGSVAEAVARNLAVPTLLLPLKAEGFVDADTGALSLSRILVPLGDLDEAQQAVDAAAWFLRFSSVEDSELFLLHAADESPIPHPVLPPGLSHSYRSVSGSVDSAIVTSARDTDACLIVMVTRGHDSFWDVLSGSHTERVLHEAQCPVLFVPLE